ncbi:MAG: GNAT family N-acetyltransferase [Rhizobium sp.]|nr:GNAT family N-acetyltransferase [Rhizobium sp.]
MRGLELRTGYFADRASFLALADLLRDIFDIDIGLLDRFSGPDPTAMPFGWFDAAGRCVANFSAFSMPLVVDGQAVRAVGYQSGAVRPDYRAQGLYGDLMRRAFAWAEAEGFEAGLLLTDKPDLYRPHGFETVPQHLCRGPMPEPTGAVDARPLSLDDSADLALVTDVLEDRGEVSGRFSVRGQTRTFLLNACFDPDVQLSHLPALGAVIAWKREGRVLRLLDVVAKGMPTLAAIIGALGARDDAVEILFAPDRLGWDGREIAYQGSCDLMIRDPGRRAKPSRAFMLPPTMEF